MTKPLTVLLHGLHQNRYLMYPLAWQLHKAGYHTYAHDYASLAQDIDVHSRTLNIWLTAHHNPHQPINLIGHSLGGLVMRHFLENFGQAWQIGRCVTLGTPHQGSVCANYANKLLPPLVRRAYPNALDGQCVALPDNIELGIIAGNRPLGLGLPILTYHNKRHQLMGNDCTSDGTVYLSETYLPQAKDRIVLPVSHTGLLTDKTTAKQVIYFLEHGRFLHQ